MTDPFPDSLRRYVTWFAIDSTVAFLSIALVGVMWRLSGPLDIGLERALGAAILLAFVFSVFNSLLGLKSVSWAHPAADDVVRLFVSCGLVTIAMVASHLVFRADAFLPVSFTYAAGLSVLFGFVAVRYRLRLITSLASRWITLRKSSFGAPERVLMVGAGAGREFAVWMLGRPEFRRIYTVVGIADDDPGKQGMSFNGLKVLGPTTEIADLVRRHDIGVIFYAIAHAASDDRCRILGICKRTGLRTVVLSDVLATLHHHMKKDGLESAAAEHTVFAASAAE